jgi:hypothetical protein
MKSMFAIAICYGSAVVAAMDGKEIFVHDCKGGVHVAVGTPLEMNANVQTLKLITDKVSAMFYERATCMCPGLTKEDHLRFVQPSVEMLLGLFQGSSHKFGLQEAAKQVGVPHVYVLPRSSTDLSLG